MVQGTALVSSLGMHSHDGHLLSTRYLSTFGVLILGAAPSIDPPSYIEVLTDESSGIGSLKIDRYYWSTSDKRYYWNWNVVGYSGDTGRNTYIDVSGEYIKNRDNNNTVGYVYGWCTV